MVQMPPASVARFGWATGARVPVAPEQAAEEIDRLFVKHGEVSPDALILAARDKKNPLHPAFTWNDRDAAAERRIDQARYVLRSLVVSYEHADGTRTPPIRYMIKLQDERSPDGPTASRSYIAVTTVIEDADLRTRWVQQALREFQSWRRRYQSIQEFAELNASADVIEQELQRLQG